MPKREPNQVGAKNALRQLREAVNLTQEQVAYHMKKAASTIRRWEKGEEPALTRKEWLKLCELLKVDFHDLPDKLSSPIPEQPSENS